MEVYRTPISTTRIPPQGVAMHSNLNQSRFFSDFDNFASQALGQLNTLKTSNTAVSTSKATLDAVPTIQIHHHAHLAQPQIRKAFAAPAAASVAKKNLSAKPEGNLPKWVPGHYKTNNAAATNKSFSPQRARNVYRQQQQQQQGNIVLTQQPQPVLGTSRSLSAPANQSLQHRFVAIQQQQLKPTQQPFQSQYSGFHQAPQVENHNPHVETNTNDIPFNKMTIEQITKALKDTSSEVKNAIRISPNEQQTSEGALSAPHSRRPSDQRSKEKEKQIKGPYNSRNRTDEYHRNRRRISGPKYNDHSFESPSPARRRSNKHSGSHSDTDNDRNHRYHHRPRPKLQDDRRNNYEYEDNVDHECRYGDHSHEKEKRRKGVPTRLDYTDFSDSAEEVEPYHANEEYIERRNLSTDYQESHHSSARDVVHRPQEYNKSKRSLSPIKPKSPIRSRSAPPVSSPQSRKAPTPKDQQLYSSKGKSPLPRQDLLEWSKRQAWQKHVTTEFSLAKEIYSTIKEPSSSNRPGSAHRNDKSRMNDRNAAAEQSQRTRQYEESLLNKPYPSTTAVPIHNENKGKNSLSKSGMGSFFDFMKTRGGPSPPNVPSNQAVVREPSNRGQSFGFAKKNTTKSTGSTNNSPEKDERKRMINDDQEAENDFLLHTKSGTAGKSQSATEQLYLQHRRNLAESSVPSTGFSSKISPEVLAKLQFAKVAPVSNGIHNKSSSTLTHSCRERVVSSPEQQQSGGSTISLEQQNRMERTQSNNNTSNTSSSYGAGGDTLIDVAEWQRLANWLTSIKMEKYVPNFREHGVTKLSLIELFEHEDFWDLRIASEDIPIFQQKVGEFAQRIKSFSEEPLSKHNKKSSQANRDSQTRKHPKGTFRGDAEDNESIVSNFDINHKPSKIYPRIDSMETFISSLLTAFDESNYQLFMNFWEQFLYNHLLPEMVAIDNSTSGKSTMSSHRPALFYAKQAIEFHFYVYFYVSAVRKGRGNQNKDDIFTTKLALKKYLERLTLQYDDHTTSNFSFAEEIAQNQDPNISSHLDDSSPHPANSSPRPLITSREFATFAGLVFVPNPQQNPAFHTLFREEWTLALRQRLSQFTVLLFEESKKHAATTAAIDITPKSSSPQPQIQQNAEVIMTPTKAMLTLESPTEDLGEDEEEEIAGEHNKQKRNKAEIANSLIVNTNEISPIQDPPPPLLYEEHSNKLSSVPAADVHQHQFQSHFGLEPPFEKFLPNSPGSNASTISQLTDETPLKHENRKIEHHNRHQNSQQQAVSQPVQQQQQAVSALQFQNSSNVLNDATNRSSQKLKSLQQQQQQQSSQHQLDGSAKGVVAKTRVNTSPPKSSLQMQVDQYNKLLKQNKLPKQQNNLNSNTANSTSNSNITEPLGSSAAKEITPTDSKLKDETKLFEEMMENPENKALVNQIDTVIAPINKPQSSPELRSLPASSSTDSSSPFALAIPMEALQVSVLPPPVTKFNLGVNLIARGLSNQNLNEQVNVYKNLLKSTSKSHDSLPAEDSTTKNNSVSNNDQDGGIKFVEEHENIEPGMKEVFSAAIGAQEITTTILKNLHKSYEEIDNQSETKELPNRTNNYENGSTNDSTIMIEHTDPSNNFKQAVNGIAGEQLLHLVQQEDDEPEIERDQVSGELPTSPEQKNANNVLSSSATKKKKKKKNK